MRWRTTAVLAALAALAAAAYLLYQPEWALPPVEKRLVVPEVRPDQVTRIELARADGREVVLEKVSSVPVASWILRPSDRPADASVVQAMLDGIVRLTWSGALDPGRPEADPAVTGLGAPRLSVTLVGEGARVTLRFGNHPPINLSAVFGSRDGDKRVFLAEAEVFQAFDKSADQVRSRKLVHFDPHRVVRLEIEDRFVRVRGKGDREVVYEKSAFERSEGPPEKGWFLRKPWEERLDDLKVQTFLVDLAAMTVEEFKPAGDWKAMGLDQPQFVASVTPFGAERPVVVQFGDPVTVEGKKCLYAHVAGSGEVARIECGRFESLPRHRGQFRSDAVFPGRPAEVREISLEAEDLGRAVLQRREIRTRKDQEDLVTWIWEAVEPQGIRFDRDRAERFVGNLWVHRITEFLGEQPDPAIFGLAPPAVTVRIRMDGGGEHALTFGKKGEGPAYMMRAGRSEIFAVNPELVKYLRLMDLNFRTFEMFNVPRDAIRGFRFEYKASGLEPIYYALRRDPAEGAWKFADKVHERDQVDQRRVDGLLEMMNFIKADRFITREPGAAARYRLRDGEAAGTLWIFTDGGPEGGVELYISKDLSERPGIHRYYACFKGDAIVFEINPLLVESLKRIPLKEAD